MTDRALVLIAICLASVGALQPVFAQSAGPPAAPPPRPSGQVSVFTNVSQAVFEDGLRRAFAEISTSATYALPDRNDDGLIWGVDLRQAHRSTESGSDRLSVYEAYAGARAAGGRVILRGGHLWLNELGALGSVAGGAFEIRQPPRPGSRVSALRIGGFGGLEPNIFNQGYAQNVTKYGGYVAFDGERARRQAVGLVIVRNQSLTERSVLTAMNVLPVGSKFFLYQAAEYDVSAPGGKGRGGLNYFMTNARVMPAPRLGIQGTFNRGRSIDARGISEDSLNGRTVAPTALEGFLYQSVGVRVTVEVVPRVRINGGYSRDKNNRDDAPTGRVTIGGYAGDLLKSGFDASATDSWVNRSTGAYHSRYVSVGRQIGRSVYVSGDVSTSLSVVRFSRSDGVVVELRPKTLRLTGTASIYLRRSTSLLVTVDRTHDTSANEFRVLSGISYRFR